MASRQMGLGLVRIRLETIGVHQCGVEMGNVDDCLSTLIGIVKRHINVTVSNIRFKADTQLYYSKITQHSRKN